jgi:hypothetical protein
MAVRIGDSGMGAYHAAAGFRAFSDARGALYSLKHSVGLHLGQSVIGFFWSTSFPSAMKPEANNHLHLNKQPRKPGNPAKQRKE